MCTLRAAEAGSEERRWPGHRQVEKDSAFTPAVPRPGGRGHPLSAHHARPPAPLEGTRADALPAPAPSREGACLPEAPLLVAPRAARTSLSMDQTTERSGPRKRYQTVTRKLHLVTS